MFTTRGVQKPTGCGRLKSLAFKLESRLTLSRQCASRGPRDGPDGDEENQGFS